jgi:hypothetical protein
MRLSPSTRGFNRPKQALATAATVTMATAAVIASGAGPAGAATGVPMIRAENFQIMTTSAASKGSSIVATGAFTAGGVITGNFGNSQADTVRLPGGTFKITTNAVGGSGTDNRSTCLSTSHVNGTYQVRGGTGKYASLSGSGQWTLSSVTIDSRDPKGHCTRTPTAYQQAITLHGHVSG